MEDKPRQLTFLLAGAPETGKTSLLLKTLYDVFPEYKRTNCAEVFPPLIREYNGKKYSIVLWDQGRTPIEKMDSQIFNSFDGAFILAHSN